MLLLLTKDTTPIIGQVASLLGYIMNGIFWLQSKIGLENIGLCIIFFTIVIYVLMLPLTVQQQKFSKLQSKMSPELQAVQKKYKGKQDQVSMQKMQEETQAVYAKYGVNPMGSCLQLVIQMPILFALYRVIWNIPAYVTIVKDAFMPLAQKLTQADGALEYLSEVGTKVGVKVTELTDLKIIDTLYKFKPENWAGLAEKFPDLSELITSTQTKIDHFNHFLGLNIANNPMNIIMESFKDGKILLVILAVLVPVLAAVTQWLNSKLMVTDTQTGDEENAVANSMKTMNTVMPIMSAVFCLTLPVGLGIYWIAGAVVRSILQVVINRRFDKVGMDEMIRKNQEKAEKKREKRGITAEQMTSNATVNTRSIGADSIMKKARTLSDTDAAKSEAKPGSLADKARMVEKYNSSHGKK